MKLTCTQENFSLGLNIVSHLGDKNINLPILNNVLLQSKKEGLTLVSTNLEIGIRTKIRGKIESEGEFTVNARLLADFINTLKKENVALELEEKNLHIKGENHQTTIRGMDAADFPVIPQVESTYSFTVAAGDLKHALSQVLFAVSADESRPELNGVFMQIAPKHCTLAATDSYRLAEKKFPIELHGSESKDIIIPARSLHEVLRILDLHDSEKATVAVNDNQVLFTFDDTEIVSRIIAGDYPDYKQIIPKEFKNSVELNCREMVQAIKTTSLFCRQGINDVRISLDKCFKDIAINAENSTLGKNVSNVPSLSAHQEMDIVFNYKFLLDGLSHIVGETAALKTNDATSPALLASAHENDFIYIIMPIKQ